MTGTASIHSVGTLIAGEGHLEIEPKFPIPAKKPGLMFVHGAGYDANYCTLDVGDQGKLTAFIINNGGFSVASDDNGGTETWGNAVSSAALVTNVNALQARSTVKASSKVALFGASMGVLGALNYALANPTKVSCIVGIIPVMNPNDIHTNHRTVDGTDYAPFLDSAYSGGYQEARDGATRNPFTYKASSAIADIPMLFFYGLSDTLCLPTYTEQFAAAAPSKRTLVGLAGGHAASTYQLVNYQTALDFLNTYNV